MRTDEPLAFAWYLPTEGDGHHLGTRLAERPPTFTYLADVIRTAERAGFDEILIPTGNANDSFAAEAPMAESWTTATLLAPVSSRIRLLVAVRGGVFEGGPDEVVARLDAVGERGVRVRLGQQAEAAPQGDVLRAVPRAAGVGLPPRLVPAEVAVDERVVVVGRAVDGVALNPRVRHSQR